MERVASFWVGLRVGMRFDHFRNASQVGSLRRSPPGRMGDEAAFVAGARASLRARATRSVDRQQRVGRRFRHKAACRMIEDGEVLSVQGRQRRVLLQVAAVGVLLRVAGGGGRGAAAANKANDTNSSATASPPADTTRPQPYLKQGRPERCPRTNGADRRHRIVHGLSARVRCGSDRLRAAHRERQPGGGLAIRHRPTGGIPGKPRTAAARARRRYAGHVCGGAAAHSRTRAGQLWQPGAAPRRGVTHTHRGGAVLRRASVADQPFGR
eukprot:ctg_3241.g475